MYGVVCFARMALCRCQRPFSVGRKRCRALLVMLGAAYLFGSTSNVRAAEPLLPDIFCWADEDLNYIYGGFFDLNAIRNKVLYRFTGALPNIGAGPLEVREVTHPNDTQDVYQRIYDDQGGVSETLIGSFPNANPAYGHLWLEGIAQYNLRTVLPGDGVGAVVATKDKTSQALVDGNDYDLSLPGAPPAPVYDSQNDPYQGVSVGWADIYSYYIPGQWIDVTGLPNGQYWLEVVADPYNRIIESNDTNNTVRIKVTLFIPDPQIAPGDYNDDGTIDAADYVVWRKTLGQTVALGTGADGDGNGVIQQADFDVWRARFGETAGSGSSVSAAPEPGAAMLLWLGGGWSLFVRARRAGSRDSRYSK
jgi:hypothetical protein